MSQQHHLITFRDGPSMAIDHSPVEEVVRRMKINQAYLKKYPTEATPDDPELIFSMPITEEEFQAIRDNAVERVETAKQ